MPKQVDKMTDEERREAFTDIRHHSSLLIPMFDERDLMYYDLVKAFLMDWQEKPSADWILPTMSPSAFNAAIGAIRLLTAGEPQIIVPFNEADDKARQLSEKVEFAAKAMWNRSGRIGQRPVHYDIVFSAVLFGEICGSITKTSDLVKYAKASKNRAAIARMNYIARETPYLFQVYNPAECYPSLDKFGLRSLLRRTQTTWGEVLDTWGDAAERSYSGKNKTEIVVLNDYYDWAVRAVWLDTGIGDWIDTGVHQVPVGGTEDPIYLDFHGLDFMPVVDQIAEGTNIFAKPEQQRLPLLYALYKSGMWKRENMALTVVFSLMHALGSMPMLVRTTSTPGTPLTINRTMGSNVIDLGLDEKLGPLAEKVIDPSVLTSMQIAERIVTESTIPKIALGGAPQHALAYSSISLLSQSGRLPLISPKEMSGAVVGNLILGALRWIKQDGNNETFYGTEKGEAMMIGADEIPEHAVIKVNLEPDLPQDKLQLASVAQLIVASGLASKRFARENFLHIGQSGAMDKEIFMERRMEEELRGILAQVQAMAQAKAQASITPPTPVGPGGPEGGPPTTPSVPQPAAPPGPPGAGGLPPEIAGMMAARAGGFPPGRVTAGNPLAGPVVPPTERR